MKRNGFTLIELLAVIVILAVIALIATPIVLNIIEKARASARVSSANGVLESAKLFYTESMLNPNILYPSTGLEFICDGKVCQATAGTTESSEQGIALLTAEPDIYQLECSGQKPSSGSIIIQSDGTIIIHNIAIDNNVCTYDETKKVFTAC